MTVVQTVLVFVAIPLAVVALVTIAVYGRSAVHQPTRYRPGKAWTYPPSWYVPHPEAVGSSEGRGATTAVGGASGEW